MAFCSHCGTPLPSGANFCPSCGAAVRAPIAPTMPTVAPTDTPTDPLAPAAPHWYNPFPAPPRRSVFGIIGLATAILSLLLVWVDAVLIWILVPATVFSLIGFFKSTKSRRLLTGIAILLCVLTLVLFVTIETVQAFFPDSAIAEQLPSVFPPRYPDEIPDFDEGWYDDDPFYFDEGDPFGDFFFEDFFGDEHTYESALPTCHNG